MLWLTLSLSSAFFTALGDALLKRFFSDLNALEMGLIRILYCAPWIIGPFLAAPQPSVAPSFWLMTAAVLPLEITALILYMRALQISPMSLSIPFLAFTPVWMILAGWVILDELPGPFGATGIFIIVVGAYILNLNRGKHGILDPVKALFREPGSRLMLLVSAIYAITASMGKKLTLMTGALWFGTMYFLLLAAVMTVVFTLTGKVRFKKVLSRPWRGLAAGLCFALMVLTHFWAISLAQASYMVAVKRSSLIFSVLFGRLFFGETSFGSRLAGSLIMFVGLAVISLWG